MKDNSQLLLLSAPQQGEETSLIECYVYILSILLFLETHFHSSFVSTVKTKFLGELI